MQIRNVHPFPARMAPELALNSLQALAKGSTILDPMSGSGTVLRQAAELGHHAVGFDMDPLAVLMSKVWTAPVDKADVEQEMLAVLKDASLLDPESCVLPWQDEETLRFISYWFDTPQQHALSALAFALNVRRSRVGSVKSEAVLNVLQVALSRIIVTKEQAASLARDTSHSRPHRVSLKSTYDVFSNFSKSVQQLVRRLDSQPNQIVSVNVGDARAIKLNDCSVDAVVTSPPYLNAIDYMRGHRMSLVWLGHSISELRSIRSNSVGAERAADKQTDTRSDEVVKAMCDVDLLLRRHQMMIHRYAIDLIEMLGEVSRVLKVGAHATYVVGNSCLKESFIRNSDGVGRAGEVAGLILINSVERELPMGSRYLPMTINGSLSKRMRTETVLTFKKV
ncbi:hypothetical protein [Pseudomonas sp. 18175]|uniref:hypothetical protein n=1 Tax=Pseudomonas sp. 18175 TaxID=3390056 RepID=UPI003D1C84FC